MNILLSHPTGNANVRGLLNGLNEQNMLHSFHTSAACFSGSTLDKLTIFPLLREFQKRSFPIEVRSKTVTYPFMELGRIAAQKLKIKNWTIHETGRFCPDRVGRHLDKRVATYISKHSDISAVYAYEDVAASVFQEAKKREIKCIYDLPTGYWRSSRELLQEEIDRYPAWRDTFTGFKDSEEKLSVKDMELNLADVVYVASRFTANTLKKYPGKLPSIKVIPYGFPPANEPKIFKKKDKIKFLFVGKLSQQKGIADIFEAIKGFEKYIELTLIGSKCHNVILDKELNKHTYLGTIPHDKVLSAMREHDVLLFPSLFDGFGMVITEAMSQGTPVIASERSCAPDLIEHGKNGWLMKAGSVISLRKTIETILDNPLQIEQIGFQAIQTAQKRPWSKYGQEMAESIQQFLNNV
jgi:glycosyltransferase involved in cell wall biosynthesis